LPSGTRLTGPRPPAPLAGDQTATARTGFRTAVQVQRGEGAVTTLSMRQSQWIGLCPAVHVGLPATGHPFWRGLVKPNVGEGGV
jgi:hypothetical protein